MVKVIRQSKLTKDSVAKLSDQFQVSNSVIRKVLNGLTYKGI
jgi:DeoR/GlpR family transcriptional regulator of sugar metabolism